MTTLVKDEEKRQILLKAGWKETRLGWRHSDTNEYGAGFYRLLDAYRVTDPRSIHGTR